MTFASFVVVALLSIFGVASIMEFYKKTIRKGQSKTWENWVVGAVLSFGVATLDCLTGIAYIFFPNAMVVNILIYGVVFFFVQMFVDMKIIKALITSAMATMDIEKFVLIILDKFGLTVDKIKGILKKLGITQEKFAEALRDAGFPEDKIETLIKMFYE